MLQIFLRIFGRILRNDAFRGNAVPDQPVPHGLSLRHVFSGSLSAGGNAQHVGVLLQICLCRLQPAYQHTAGTGAADFAAQHHNGFRCSRFRADRPHHLHRHHSGKGQPCRQQDPYHGQPDLAAQRFPAPLHDMGKFPRKYGHEQQKQAHQNAGEIARIADSLPDRKYKEKQQHQFRQQKQITQFHKKLLSGEK